MAKSQDLPGFREKRKILFGKKTSPEQLREAGRRFSAAGRYDDALEFFTKTEADQEVREIVRLAVEQGDTPLFLRAKLVLGETPTEQEFSALARVAEASGRKSVAYVAYLKAGRQEEAERLRSELGLSGEPSAEGPSDASPAAAEAESSE